MRNSAPVKLAAIIGLILLPASFVIKHYWHAEPDGADGLIKGAAIGLLLISLIKLTKYRSKAI